MGSGQPIFDMMMSYLRLIRYVNLLLLALIMYVPAVWCGYSMGFPSESWWSLHLLVWGSVLIAAGGNAQNDIFDIEIDRINRPDRPLPAGEVTPQKAGWVYLTVTILGVAACFTARFAADMKMTINPTLFAVLILWWYARYGKRSAWLGNLAVAIVCTMPIWLTWYWIKHFRPAVDNQVAALYIFLAVSAFGLTWVREIVKDIIDLKGDSKAGAITLPTAFGVRRARMVALFIGCGVLSMEVAYGQWMLFGNQTAAGIFVLLGCVMPTLYAVYRLSLSTLTLRQIKQVDQLLKVLMGIGVFTTLFWKF